MERKKYKNISLSSFYDSLFWAWGLTLNVVNMFYEYINAKDKN